MNFLLELCVRFLYQVLRKHGEGIVNLFSLFVVYLTTQSVTNTTRRENVSHNDFYHRMLG
jgi:hypothetical protein